MILSQNDAGSKPNSYKVMRRKMFKTMEKVKPNTGTAEGLNLAALNHTTIKVTKVLLQQKLSKIRHNTL
jgi:hypothetical protein